MSRVVTFFLCLFALAGAVHGQISVKMRVPVEPQPLSANITRVLQALQFLGTSKLPHKPSMRTAFRICSIRTSFWSSRSIPNPA